MWPDCWDLVPSGNESNFYILMSLDAFTVSPSECLLPMAGSCLAEQHQEPSPSSVQLDGDSWCCSSPSCTEWTEKCCSNFYVPQATWSSPWVPGLTGSWSPAVPHCAFMMMTPCPDDTKVSRSTTCTLHVTGMAQHLDSWGVIQWKGCANGGLKEMYKKKFFPFSILLVLSASLQTALKSSCNPLQTPQGLSRLWNCPRLAVCLFTTKHWKAKPTLL